MRSRSANGLMSYKDLLHFTPQIRLLYQSVYGRTFYCFQEPTAQRRTVGLVRQHACAKRGPHLRGLGEKTRFSRHRFSEIAVHGTLEKVHTPAVCFVFAPSAARRPPARARSACYTAAAQGLGASGTWCGWRAHTQGNPGEMTVVSHSTLRPTLAAHTASGMIFWGVRASPRAPVPHKYTRYCM